MSDQQGNEIAEFYRNRHVFYTGATGFVGTVFLSRLVLETPVAKVYAVVRGGESRLWDVWRENLPLDLVQKLQKSQKLVTFDGDITQPNCGLDTEGLNTIHDQVSIFIHGASPINLQIPLQKAIQQILQPSVAVAEMAFKCPKLIHFTYISTAYANTFLRYTASGTSVADAVIPEDVVAIIPGSRRPARDEFLELLECGTSEEYKAVQHPFNYSYAKHLSERLLLEMFQEVKSQKKLLVFRPSCIGPAISKPFPFFEVAGSAPYTNFMASLIDSPAIELVIPTQLRDPADAAVDELPVDIVANRLIVHVALGSSGCVHAVAGRQQRKPFEAAAKHVARLRSPWRGYPSFHWVDYDWKTKDQWSVARNLVVLGTSYVWEDGKANIAWERMSESDRSLWPLWSSMDLTSKEYLVGRSKALQILIRRNSERKSGLLKSVSKTFLGPADSLTAKL